MNKNAFGRAYSVLPVLSIVFTVFLASCAPGAASSTSLQVSNQSVAQQVPPQYYRTPPPKAPVFQA